MNRWSLEQIAEGAQGQILSRINPQVSGFGTDTRADLQGQLFIALRGDQFDAHNFLDLAVQKKAACLLVDKKELVTPEILSKASVILVRDTLKGLQNFAQWHRRHWKGFAIGITGSNGKTSTKEFMASTIGASKSVFYSKGSFNNHWGVPFSLLQLEPSHQVALIEIGMNRAGEITDLLKIAEPDAVVCTMVGRAHIEFFGTIEKIAEVKEETYIAAKPDAVRVYNLDNIFTRKMFEKSKSLYPRAEVLTFSETNPNADVNFKMSHMTLQDLTIEGQIRGPNGTQSKKIAVPVFGKQNLVNLMAAAAGALTAGLSPEQIWKGLATCHTVWGRNQLLKTEQGADVIFDAYNANPDSMIALLDNVQALSGSARKVGVFGQMLEMGDLSATLHEELGYAVAKTELAHTFFYGADHDSFARGFARGGGQSLVSQADYSPEFGDRLKSIVRGGDLVVFKGSRGMKLERALLKLSPLNFSEKK